MKLSQAIARAKSIEGMTENPPFSNRVAFIDEVDKTWWLGFSRQGSQWCGTYIDWIFGQSMLPNTMYTVFYGMNYFKMAGRWSHVARKGDVVFEVFDNTGLPGHIEMVLDVLPDHILTIGGNTVPNGGGNQTNGGGVYQRTRYAKNIVGYGMMNYEPETQEEPEMPFKMNRKTSSGEISVFSAAGKWKVKDMATLRKWQSEGILEGPGDTWIEMTDEEYDSIPTIPK